MLDIEPGLCNPNTESKKKTDMSTAINSTLVGSKWRSKNEINVNKDKEISDVYKQYTNSSVNLFEVKKKKNLKGDAAISSLQSSMGNWLKVSDNKKNKKKKGKNQENIDIAKDAINVNKYSYNEEEDY